MMSVLETDEEIQHLQHDLQQVQEDRERLQAVVETKDVQLQQKDDQIQRQGTQLQHKDGQIQRQGTQLQQQDAQLQQKDTQLQHKDDQIQRQATELRKRTLQLNRQLREVQTLREDKRLQAERLQAEVQAKDSEIDRQQRELQSLTQQAQEKDAEIHRQQRELQTLRIQKDEQLAAAQWQLQAETDARFAAIQQQLQERDAEIKRLQKELREQTASRDKSVAAVQSPPQKSVAAAQSPRQKPQTHTLSELTWRRLPDMPEAMQWPQSVTIEGILYVNDRGGGSDILRYDLHKEQWCEPVKHQYWACGMTAVSSQLVMVGGLHVSTVETSKTVRVYAPSQRSWKQPYPPMNTPRQWPAVFTYHQRLVVAGGRDDSVTDLAAVEILDTFVSHSQWLSATPLPVSCSLMSSAIIHGTLYLLGGSLGKQVLSVSLSALTQTDKPLAQWRTLPDAPLKDSTAIDVHGSLLAVGGSHGGQRSSAIHAYYDQEKNVWNMVGDLPTERRDCACCLLPSREILVAGGDSSMRRMDVTVVKDYR